MTPCTALVKYRGQYGRVTTSIKMLLKMLGLPKSVWGVRNFWEHWHGQLDLILHDAEKLYRIHAKRVHPRRNTDAEEESKQLNVLWATIKRRFRQHTWLDASIVPKRNPNALSLLPPPPPGFMARTCPLPKCGIRFFTKLKRKKYCCQLHGKIHKAAIKYITKIRPRKKKLLFKCQFKSCGSLFWATAPRPGARTRKFCSEKCSRYFHIYKFRAEHPEITNARSKNWREKNVQRHRDANKKYRQDNPDKVRKAHREYARKRSKLRKKLKKLKELAAQRQTRLASQPLAKC